ncbi:MAG: alginate O-acetyltransferase AlgX-related protein [Christensenellales bacterium]
MKKVFVCLILLALLGGWLLQGPLVTAWGYFNRALHDTGQAQVVAGRNGWLYFREALDSTLGTRRMSDADMDALAQALSDINSVLKKQGTAFVLLVAPDKAVVYPQHLPWCICPHAPEHSNRTRLLTRLAALGVTAPDLTSLLRENTLPTYLPTDTHWSAYGAWLAAREALTRAGYTLPDYTVADFTRIEHSPGDLHRMILPGAPDAQTDAFPAQPPAYRALPPMRSADDMRITTRGTPDGPTLYVARDSFGRALLPYLASAASSMTFVRTYAHFADNARGCDVALLVVAERNLGTLLSLLRETP